MANEPSNTKFLDISPMFPLPRAKVNVVLQASGLFPLFYDNRYGNNMKPHHQHVNTRSRANKDNTCDNCHQLNQNEDANKIVIEPRNFGLVPLSEWSSKPQTLTQIQNSYFSRRNGIAHQFDIKVYNALCITKHKSGSYNTVGVYWIDSAHFKVNEKIFSKFLGYHDRKDLFDKQGQITKYGFERVYKNANPKFARNNLCNDVDDFDVKIYRDPMKRFSMDKYYRRIEY